MNQSLVLYNKFTMTKEKLAQILGALRAGLEELLGDQLAAIYLYGSYASGEAAAGSDIDVLIVIRDNFDYSEMLDRTIDLVADISLEHDVVVSRAFVSKDRFEHEMSPFMMNVRREAVPA
jgi:predicted nucleotidyltransferase